MTFRLQVSEWLSPDNEPDVISQTSGWLSIVLDDRVATHVEDEWSKSVRDSVFLSMYPLALWLASSWWRLRWEPAPETPTVAWRMAHEMTAAGSGFVWPRMAFEFDGQRIDVFCRHTEKTPIEPIRYLEDMQRSISTKEFEYEVDSFINLVLERLNVVSLQRTELELIWREVCEERRNPEAAAYRRLEAGLGYDPDEAPEELVESLRRLSRDAGESAVAEIGPACAGDDPGATLGHVVELARSTGVEGRVDPLKGIARTRRDPAYQCSTWWEQGWRLAQLAREGWEIPGGKVSDRVLSQILGVDASVAQGTTGFRGDGPRQPVGLAIRSGDADRLNFHFRKANHHGRRFETARFLADILTAPATDRWLPSTDLKTARQRVQRAFAAEFLCPIVELQAFLDGDLSDEAIEDASGYFDVSPLTVRSHLTNHRFLLGDLAAG